MLLYLWVLCLLMPLACVWGAGCLFWIATDRPHVIPQEAGMWMVTSAIVAAPFVVLAALATSGAKHQPSPSLRRSYVSASVAGMIVTFLVWGVFYYDGYTYWAERKTSGANIGLGCFMLVSPAAVVLAMLGGRRLFNRDTRA